jgi:hypothetical protein
MIIDRTQLAGLDAYLRDNAGKVNLAGQTARTAPLGRGKQLEISAIELLIESDSDLLDLFNLNLSRQSNPPVLEPLFSITVMKEMFPALFANPFAHRVHTIAGFDDFKRGTLENGRVLDVDGIPTIVSVGTGICKWTSPLYPMPEAIRLDHASWELAASRKTPAENFEYELYLDAFDASQQLLLTVRLTAITIQPTSPSQLEQHSTNPTAPRKCENLDLKNASFYQLRFSAVVKRDASVYEKHTMLVGESIGTPLLRAINLLEPVESIYNIYSLQELLSRSSEYHLFEFQGQPLKKMLVTLDLTATLVHSDNENLQGDKYEFIEITVRNDLFSNVEGKLVGEILLRVSS